MSGFWKVFISMHSIRGWASFCMNYCINAAWHGVDQSVALLRCNGSPGCFDSGLQVICIVGSGVSHLPLDNTPWILYGVQVRQVCWPIKHGNTMVIEPAFGTFGTLAVGGSGGILWWPADLQRAHCKDCSILQVCTILHNIRKMRPFLTEHAAQLLVQALVISRVDYGNALLAGLPSNTIKPLQMTQSVAARSSMSPNEPMLHLSLSPCTGYQLKLAARSSFKTLMLAYRTTTGSAPAYFHPL